MLQAILRRSVLAAASATGKRREMQAIVAARRQVSEAPIAQVAPKRYLPARPRAIVRRGHATVRGRERRAARRHGLRRRTTTATAQLIPTAAVRTNHRSGRNEICPPTTTIADIRSPALTIPPLPP